ncbi:HEPN domain-containing protein [Bacteroides fragilis]|jgi:hypothetical protein|uniref:HEPN domain-containing protein n=2 Tax=Bacteroidales TaxID=171549 RepID=B7BEW7_9BACT|nr:MULTISPECIES: HEPN domain-containing protein [Bacteroidales]RJV60068.1 HEPN domain-containing protein [Bacteroides sp. AF16-29]RJX07667.1 HEPN domain-containing protein [Bacteroides sp. AF15-23LB]EEC95036.1 hypothetical protein PRABACTJOHN_03596 [Parabacteroides johnsonii DSM 18315]MCG0197001.1 HEPN domain-containing protein [Phocaeicola vulgatus]MCM0250237.1 HEPN domain-containing protein [Bacteroides fragilis]
MSRNRKLVKENLHTEDVNDAYAIIAGCNCAGIKWYIVATENLATAKVLFKNERFAHCIFFLQQCVECLIKGILLECDVIDRPIGLGHAPEEAFKELYERFDNGYNAENCKFISQAINGIENNFEKKLPIIVKLVNKATTVYSNNYIMMLTGHDEVKYNYVNTVLYCLGILFNGTEATTRYPDKEVCPEEKYSTNAIQTQIPSLLNLIERIIGIITWGLPEYNIHKIPKNNL